MTAIGRTGTAGLGGKQSLGSGVETEFGHFVPSDFEQ